MPVASLSETPAPSATVAACAGDTWDDDLDPEMTLDGTPFRFQYQSALPSNGAGGWSDSVPGPTLRFGREDAQVVEAASGSAVQLRPSDAVMFTDARMELYVLDANDELHADTATPVDASDLAVVDGALEVPMPADAGHWLLNIYGRWSTACASGDGYVDLLLITS
jgi:hypothetical protein